MFSSLSVLNIMKWYFVNGVCIGCIILTSWKILFISGHTYRYDVFSLHNGTRFVTFGNHIFGYGLFARQLEYSEANRWLGPVRYLYGCKGSSKNVKVSTSLQNIHIG